MSEDLSREVWFLLHSMLLGIGIVVLYDILRIFRNIIKHKNFLIGLEDILFWITSGLLIFRMLYKENDGILRWFSIGGIILGMLVYHVSISQLLVRYISLGLNMLIKYVLKFIGIVTKPFRYVFRKFFKAVKKTNDKKKRITKYYTKRLKNLWKTIKIGVNKL